MSTTRQVAQGTMRLLSGQVLARVVDFALYLLLARSLGVEGFGLYTFALSFVLLFNVVADLGVSTVLTREAARTPDRMRALLRHALALKAGSAAVAVMAIVVVAVATRITGPALALIAVAGVSLALRSVTLLFEGLLKAANRAGSAGVAAVVGSVVSLAAAAALLAAGWGPLGAAIAWGVGGIAHLALAAWLSRRLYAPTTGWPAPAATAPTRRGMLREALPLAVSWVFIALYFRIDAVMLHVMVGEHAVGLYGGIYRVFEAFTMLAVAYRSVLFPFMARAADGPPAALAVLCRKSIRLHLAFTVLVAVFITFHARALVLLVLGARYAEAAPGLAILIWALPGSFIADTLLHLLIAQRRQSPGTRAVSLTAALNIALNLLLIPRYSFLGAALATAVSEAVCCGLLFLLFRRGVPGVGVARAVWRPIAAGVFVAALLAFLTPLLPGGLPGLALGAGITLIGYGSALVALGGISGEDLAVVRSLLPFPLVSEAQP